MEERTPLYFTNLLKFMQKNEFLAIFQNALQENQVFPINFNEAWEWIGYSRKDAAKRTLEANFTQGVDYQVLHNKVERQKVENISLSADCFKTLCMLAQTEVGKEVRQYFLECEQKLHEARTLIYSSRVQQAMAQDKQDSEIREELLALQEKVALLEASQIKEDGLPVLPLSSLGVQREHMIVREYYAYRKRAYALTRSELFALGDKLRKASLLAHQEMFYVVPDGERHPVRAFHVDVLKSVLNF